MEKIIEEIKVIIEEIADIPKDEIDYTSAMIDDLDLSSLEIMAVIADVENRFSIRITEDEMLSISTVEELARIIESKK